MASCAIKAGLPLHGKNSDGENYLFLARRNNKPITWARLRAAGAIPEYNARGMSPLNRVFGVQMPPQWEEHTGVCTICDGDEEVLRPLLPCGHWFCVDCILGWASSNPQPEMTCAHHNCGTAIEFCEVMRAVGCAREEVAVLSQRVCDIALARMTDFAWCPRCEVADYWTTIAMSPFV